jgi:hypothetical protein
MVRRPTDGLIDIQLIDIQLIDIQMLCLGMWAWNSRPYGGLREFKQTVAIDTKSSQTGMTC